jgi:hypothetical protein
MDITRFVKDVVEYQPAGKVNPGRPLRFLLGGHIETGTGYEALVLGRVMMMMMMVIMEMCFIVSTCSL